MRTLSTAGEKEERVCECRRRLGGADRGDTSERRTRKPTMGIKRENEGDVKRP